jgi:hypothetical protein
MILVLLSALIGFSPSAANAQNQMAPADSVRQEAVEKLNSLTAMRENLAATLDGRQEPITEETFKSVCAPAGKALKEWAASKGYQARQVSAKFRNPAHAPTEIEAKVLARFQKKTPAQDGPVFEPGLLNGKPGHYVFVPIRVKSSCLHCHGEKDKRPEFVKLKYPDDRAFGFKAGDLRGMYSVWF